MSNETGAQTVREVRDDPPPFLGTWLHVYVAVLCYLALLITCLYILANVFR
jgi:hypothetical protein